MFEEWLTVVFVKALECIEVVKKILYLLYLLLLLDSERISDRTRSTNLK